MVEGVAAMRRRLLKTVPATVRAAVRDAMAKSADEIVATARGLVPVESGALRDSIGWTFGTAPKGALTLASASSSAGDIVLTIYAGNDQAFYARWVEFGTQAAVPHPFFFVSYRLNKKRAKSRVSRAVNQALVKAATA